MKTISPTLQNLLENNVSRICKFIKITLSSGEIIGFTSHDKSIEIDEVTYTSAAGLEIKNFYEDTNLKSDELKTLGILDSENISVDEILSGKFDSAKIEIFLSDYENIDSGKVVIKKGYISQITSEDGKFNAKIETLSSKLNREITQVYSPLCAAKFGDSKCGFDKESLKVIGSVTAAIDKRKFSDSARSETAGYFDYGVIRFTSGNNIGQIMEVKYFVEGGGFELALPLSQNIQTGDEYELYPGCDKRFSTCKTKFSNAENFRGFPHIPGTDNLLKGA